MSGFDTNVKNTRDRGHTISRSKLRPLAQDQNQDETETTKNRLQMDFCCLRLYHKLETNFQTFITAYYSLQGFFIIFLLIFITTTNIFGIILIKDNTYLTTLKVSNLLLINELLKLFYNRLRCSFYFLCV